MLCAPASRDKWLADLPIFLRSPLQRSVSTIDFGGTVNQIAFDNVTFGSVDPRPDPVPEPATLALLGLALAGLGFASRRRKKS